MEYIHITEAKRTSCKDFFTPPRILVLGFACLILLGAVFLSLPMAAANGQSLSFIDAFFTAASAVCVTGLVVVDTGTRFTTFGQTVILLLIQLGGLGFMTFATLFAILLGRKITLKERLLLQEALNQVSLAGVVRLAKYVIKISFIIEGMGALILILRWSMDMPLNKAIYFGVFHAVSAFNNAGFDLLGNYSSLSSYYNDIVINFTIMTLIIIGGFGFAVLADLHVNKGKKFSLHTKVVFKVSTLLILCGVFIIFILEMNNPQSLGEMNLPNKLLASLFQAVTPRTAGFATLNIATLRNSTKLFIMMLMFIGASPGSTGGGIKTTTFIALVYFIICTFRGKCYITIEKRTLPKEVSEKAVVIIMLSILLIFFVTTLLTISENKDFMSLLFETVSAFGTVGLSMGITTQLSAVGKILIIFMMFSGKIGILTFAFALSQKKNKSCNLIKHPEEKIIIG